MFYVHNYLKTITWHTAIYFLAKKVLLSFTDQTYLDLSPSIHLFKDKSSNICCQVNEYIVPLEDNN